MLNIVFQCESESEVIQSCTTPCNPMDCSPPGSSIHGILQARILEWVAISFSRGSSWPRDQTQVSLIAGRGFTSEPPGNPWIHRTLLNTHTQLWLYLNISWWSKGKTSQNWSGWPDETAFLRHLNQVHWKFAYKTFDDNKALSDLQCL